MTAASTYIGIAFLAVLLLAAGADLRDRRIPNALTLSGMIAGPVLWAVLGDPMMGLDALAGAVVALVGGMFFFALGALGGGDAKLLAVVGAFLGIDRLLPACLAIGILGGLVGLGTAVRTRRLQATLVGTWMLGLHLVTLGRWGELRTIDTDGSQTIPYGAVIAAGAAFTWFMFPLS